MAVLQALLFDLSALQTRRDPPRSCVLSPLRCVEVASKTSKSVQARTYVSRLASPPVIGSLRAAAEYRSALPAHQLARKHDISLRRRTVLHSSRCQFRPKQLRRSTGERLNTPFEVRHRGRAVVRAER